MCSYRLQLNASKTEVLRCASARRQSQLPFNPLAVGSDLVSPVSCVRDLGIFIDAELTMLQPVQNAAAQLIFKACRQDHIQPLLRRLHWLQMPERISFRLAVLVYRCFHGSAPGYLASETDLQRVLHLNARRRLRSSTTSALVIPRTVRSTIGDRTFLATAASVWNSLPESVRSSPSLQIFRCRLKTELFA